MSGIWKTYNPKGFELLLVAVNLNPAVPQFISSLSLPYPVGEMKDTVARDFMQLSVMVQAYVPWTAYIDRQGVIRAQFTGNDAYFYAEEREASALVEKLLNEKTAAAAPKKSRVKTPAKK